MEIEAKFAIQDTQVYRRLQAIDRLGPYSIFRGKVHEFLDTYFDTFDRRILDVGYACRIRQSPTNTVATLKELLSSSRDANIHRREEFETNLPLSATVEQPGQWPESPVRQRILAMTKKASLVPLFSFAQHRLTRDVRLDQRKVAELCLDTVTLPHHNQTYYELEVELTQAGTEADLAAIVAHLEQIPGLSPEPRSKFERGLALPAPNPSETPEVNGPGITRDDTMAEAARKTLRYHFHQMLDNEAETRLGEDIEALHDMRVATRRMRTAFRVFADFLDADATAPYRKSLKRVGRALGEVRDLDVFRGKAEAYLETLPPNDQPDLALIKAAWDAEYARARARMLKYLDSKKFAQFKAQFGAYLNEVVEVDDTLRVRDVAPNLIYSQMEAFRAYREKINAPESTLADYHRLRIAAKHLRYTLEYFREVLSPAGERAIGDVKILQNHLGALQDAIVASVHVRHIVAYGAWHPPAELHLRWLSSPVEALGARAYLDFQVEEIQHLVHTFPEVWERYQSASFKQLITDAIAALSSKSPQTRRNT